MANDPTVQWALANPLGILISEAADAWQSGHVNDVLNLANGALLAASETGGVWLINENGTTLPLSDDWQNPDINCLAQGPDGEHHIFAGGTNGLIRETNLGEALPLLAWQEVTNPLPSEAGDVKRLLVIPRLRRLIAACKGGLYWSVIPATAPKRGCLMPFGKQPPRAPYNWKRAIMDGASSKQGYWDAAIGSTGKNQNRIALEDRRVITIVAGSFLSGGLFVGQWHDTDDLVLRPATVHNPDGTDATALFALMGGTCAVSSCETSPSVVYATCSFRAATGRLFRVLRSGDGGQTWGIGKGFVSNLEDDLWNVAGEQGRDWNNCIAASPTFTNLVALGWGAVFISADSGESWNQVQDDNHLHADIHSVRFAPEGADWAKDLYVGSDGGVARIDMDQYLKGAPAFSQSNYNRFLPTLQCYSTLIRQFWGTLAASPAVTDLIATGSQDNSNLYCVASSAAPTPWTNMDGGDGGWTAFLNGGELLHNVMGEPVTISSFDASGRPVASAPIWINQPVGLPSEMKGPVGERVKNPTFQNELGKSLVAVASPNNHQVFGLFADDASALLYHWGFLGAIPEGETITALGSFSGRTIHLGTYGKMYALDTKSGKVTELTVAVIPKDPSAKLVMGSINRIVYFSESEAFASLNGVSETVQIFSPSTGFSSMVTTSYYVLRLAQSTWTITSGNGLPNEAMYGLEAVQLPSSRFSRALFVSLNRGVYISREEGNAWEEASLNLPRMPHGGDLRFVSFATTPDAFLYLGTFGRSVWRAKLR